MMTHTISWEPLVVPPHLRRTPSTPSTPSTPARVDPVQELVQDPVAPEHTTEEQRETPVETRGEGLGEEAPTRFFRSASCPPHALPEQRPIDADAVLRAHLPMVDTKKPAQNLVAAGRLPPLPEGDVWVFVREAAERVHIHPNTLRAAVKNGALAAERLTKGTLVLRLSEVERYKRADTLHRSRAQLRRHERERVSETLEHERYQALAHHVAVLTMLMRDQSASAPTSTAQEAV